MKVPRALTIAGSDSGGGAGIQADLKTFQSLGVYGASAITAVTAQNTLGVRGIHPVPPDFVGLQIDSVLSDIGCDALKTGMLFSAETIEVVARKLNQYNLKKVVVDPVMVAKGGDRLLEEEAIEALRERLIPLALVVTPNIPEAEVLSGIPIGSREDMERAARRIASIGCGAVVVKGGHAGGEEAEDLLLWRGEFVFFRERRIPTRHTHGTGCTFSAALTACIAKGAELSAAVESAKRYVTEAIGRALPLGRGTGPVGRPPPGADWNSTTEAK